MTACAYCINRPPPMHPMIAADEMPIVAERPALPFGFGVLIGPNGDPIKPGGPNVPKPFADPEDEQFQSIIGPTGPRMFLVTFSDPSPVVMEPPDPEIEEAHVARMGELYK